METLPDTIRAIFVNAESGLRALQAVENWAWQHIVADDVLPRTLPPDLYALLSEVRRAIEGSRQYGEELFEHLCAAPNHAFVTGRLTREQYHALAFQDAVLCTHKSAGLSDYDDYDVFRQFWYQDDERCCFINPELGPRQPGRVQLRLGVCPEDLCWDRLRPEQKEFFEQQLPEFARRFRRGL